jgi:hypothetical protein
MPAKSATPTATATATAAAGPEVPEGYPADLPLVPGSTSSMKVPPDNVFLDYPSMKVDELRKVFVAKATAAGWAEYEKRAPIFYICKGAAKLSVNITGDGGKLQVGSPYAVDLPKTGCPAK